VANGALVRRQLNCGAGLVDMVPPWDVIGPVPVPVPDVPDVGVSGLRLNSEGL
jgi:hypothetical protein